MPDIFRADLNQCRQKLIAIKNIMRIRFNHFAKLTITHGDKCLSKHSYLSKYIIQLFCFPKYGSSDLSVNDLQHPVRYDPYFNEKIILNISWVFSKKGTQSDFLSHIIFRIKHKVTNNNLA